MHLIIKSHGQSAIGLLFENTWIFVLVKIHRAIIADWVWHNGIFHPHIFQTIKLSLIHSNTWLLAAWCSTVHIYSNVNPFHLRNQFCQEQFKQDATPINSCWFGGRHFCCASISARLNVCFSNQICTSHTAMNHAIVYRMMFRYFAVILFRSSLRKNSLKNIHISMHIETSLILWTLDGCWPSATFFLIFSLSTATFEIANQWSSANATFGLSSLSHLWKDPNTHVVHQKTVTVGISWFVCVCVILAWVQSWNVWHPAPKSDSGPYENFGTWQTVFTFGKFGQKHWVEWQDVTWWAA